MKIDIITFHNTSNFGATLQCTALFNYLKKQRHEVQVINYLPVYVTDKKSAAKELRNVARSKNKVKAAVKGIAYLSKAKEIKERDRRFEEFINSNLSISETYSTYEDIKSNPPEANLYICGSDQIWNPALTGGELDEAFFLRFTSGRKAAYGASMGEFEIEEHKDQLRKLTSDFGAISVRESSTAVRLSAVLEREVSTVLDCTLLLKKEDYEAMEKPVNTHDSYVLVYDMQRSSVTDQLAQNLARQENLKIIDISPNPFITHKNSTKMIGIGPGEFLTLVKNAEYVVTNSFHGTVFSIIYGKQFFSVPHSTRSGRVVDLLNSLNLSERLVRSGELQDMNPVNYDIVYSVLEGTRQGSYAYLNNVLNAQ